MSTLHSRLPMVALLAVMATAACSSEARESDFDRGTRAFEQQNFREAVDAYKAVVTADPTNLHAIRQLGLSYAAVGDRPQAMRYLENVRAKSPRDTSVRITLANIYLADGRTNDAAAEADAILKESPNNIDALKVVGAVHLSKNETAQALATYRRVAELAPKDPRSRYYVGMGLLAQGDAAGATQEFEAALAMAPTFSDALTKLVEMDIAAKRHDAAIARIRKQIAIAGDSASTHELLAITYIARGDREQAEATLLEVMKLSPTYVDPYVRLSELYRSTARIDQALDIAARGLKLDPNNLSLLLVQGVSHEAKGDRASAIRSYEAALAINPAFPAAANNLAALLAESGTDLDRALKAATAAKAADPTDPAITDTFGWVLFKRGEYAKAVAMLTEAAAKLPTEPTVAYHLGMAEEKAGDHAAARRDLGRSASSPTAFPDKDNARKALAAIR